MQYYHSDRNTLKIFVFKVTRTHIWSYSPDESMKFYNGDKVWIGGHSKVTGISKEPIRIIYDFYIKDVQKWYKK